jgi:hypothetical protein
MLSALARTTVAVLIFAGFMFAVAVIILNGCAPIPAYIKPSPPDPKPEAIPARPHHNAVWVGGHWAWTGGHYTWVPGRWDASPKGDTWVAGHWRRTPKGWVWTDGHWSK